MATTKQALLNSTMPPNAMCTNCGTGLFVINDGSRPKGRVPGDTTAKVFCHQDCLQQWQPKHCAWCGASPRTGTLSVLTTGSAGDRWYCDVLHRCTHQELLEAKPTKPLSWPVTTTNSAAAPKRPLFLWVGS